MSEKKGFALITGASSGIGTEFARQLARDAWNPVLVSRNEKKLNDLKAELNKNDSTQCIVIPADLSEVGAAEKVFKACNDRGIQIDVLINNAGVGMFGESVELPLKDTAAMLELNVVSLTGLCRLFGAEMKKRGSGYILNVGSLIGNFAAPFFASYSASKSYVLHYSIALRNELKPFGVRVCTVMPGFVSTAFDDNVGIKSEQYLKFSKQMAMTPAKVAAKGLKSLFKGRHRITPGIINKISVFFGGLFPKNAVSSLMHSFIKGLVK